ncbi:MAG: PEGA domain-containing protein [Acidobacteriota bacterium]
MADEDRSGRHNHQGHGRADHHYGSHGHGYGGYSYGGYGYGGYGYGGSRAYGLRSGRPWGHGYGALFGGHGILVGASDRSFSGYGFFDRRGSRERRSHRRHLGLIRHPSRWLYESSYPAAYFAYSPYARYKTTSSTAPAAPITGYDGTIGSYLGYEPLPVAKPELNEFDARPLPANLTLRVTPGDASIYLNGKFLGIASELPQALAVPPGKHRLDLTRPGYVAQELEIDVSDGDTVEIERQLAATNQ